jgi:hypothetical protein
MVTLMRGPFLLPPSWCDQPGKEIALMSNYYNITHRRRASFAPDFSLSLACDNRAAAAQQSQCCAVADRLGAEDAQFWCSALAIEPRYVQNVVEAANDAGFVVD